MSIQIRPAQPEQQPVLAKILTDNHLPADDLPDGLPNFWLAFDAGQLIGSAGVETYQSIGLLRSVCVLPAYRSQGVARQLVSTLTEAVQQSGVQELYLITTTADTYFSRLGFARINRSDTPAVIQQTTQFSDLCPASAVVMRNNNL